MKEKAKLVSSYQVFCSFIERDEDTGKVDVSKVFSTACYDYWVKTRKTEPKKPHESFRRCLTAHTRGSDGRKPFDEDAEAKILEVLRQKKRWPCFEKHDVSIGVQGFKALGYHETQRKNDCNEVQSCRDQPEELKKTKRASKAKHKVKSQKSDLKVDMEIDTLYPSAPFQKRAKLNSFTKEDLLNDLFSTVKTTDLRKHSGAEKSVPVFPNNGPPQNLKPEVLNNYTHQNGTSSGNQKHLSAMTYVPQGMVPVRRGMKRPRNWNGREDADKEEADFSSLMKIAQMVNQNNGNLSTFLHQKQTFQNSARLPGLGVVQASYKQGCTLYNPAGLYMLSITRDPNDPRFQMDYLVPDTQSFDLTRPIGCNMVSLKSFIHVDTDEVSRQIMNGDMRDIHGWAVRASRVEAFLTCRYGYPKLLKNGHVWMHRRVYTFDGRVLVLKVHMTLLPDGNHVFVRFQDVSDKMQHILQPPNELF
mmetsp:Transcript_5294/g.6375  ORF Transcript_5294/g.6375 Transcript_5294/m.6375 type:complete len:473 (-) Transcript_5294:797-2215(-)|eukprot:CAMPEP_0184015098 /NCGR_PEP_ID=MMETSP0954-20121128/6100_1 /TAXON_ID=627963 /ORGANISM="Aplanochytrium sp, Strain PBS07" /LENGTH=472 /DNA_ID=CAMNT_0026295801 /DNA_START=253 /DNA_END=1671 /DNA_ORIENTATION=-